MIKIVMKDGSSMDVPEGATVTLESADSDNEGVMRVNIKIANVTGLLAMKPGEALDFSTPKRKSSQS